MKKVISLVLVLLFCAMPLFSCTAAITLTGFYADAVNNINNATAVEARITLGGTMRQDGATAPIQMQTTVRYEEKDLEIQTEYSVSKDESETVGYKLINGKTYGEANGEAMDAKKAAEAIHGMTNMTIADPQIMKLQLVPIFLPEQLNDYQLTIKSNGTYIFTLAEINATALQSLPILSGLAKQALFSNVTGTMSFTATHQFAGFQIDFDMVATGASASFSYQIEFLSVGGDVHIDDPENPNDDKPNDDETTTGDPSNPNPPDEDIKAADLYQDAIAAIKAANTFEASTSLVATMKNDNREETGTISYQVKLNKNNFVIDGTSKEPNQETLEKMSCTYVDGHVYMSIPSGNKQAGAFSLEEIKAVHQLSIQPIQSYYDYIPLIDIPKCTETDLKDVTVTKNTDGTYTFSIPLTNELIESSHILRASNVGNIALIDNPTLTFVFDQNKALLSYNAKFGFIGDDMHLNAEYTIEFSNINGNVVISAPADASEYTQATDVSKSYKNFMESYCFMIMA